MTTISLSSDPRQSTLRITAEVEPPQLRVWFQGELDFACADLLQAFAEVELSAVTTVVIDLGGLEFSDAAGLRALLQFRTDHQVASRIVRLVAAGPSVRRIFALCGHEELLAA